MEELVDLGLVRHIGTSNMTIPKLELVLRDARIKPAVNEMELHPHFQQPELFQFVRDNGIEPIGYCPSARRAVRSATARRRTPRPPKIPVIRRHRPAPRRQSRCSLHQVGRPARPIAHPVFRQPLPREPRLRPLRSAHRSRDAGHRGIDKNCRLIKGQVFLWKEGQTWEALWDTTGAITPAARSVLASSRRRAGRKQLGEQSKK